MSTVLHFLLLSCVWIHVFHFEFWSLISNCRFGSEACDWTLLFPHFINLKNDSSLMSVSALFEGLVRRTLTLQLLNSSSVFYTLTVKDVSALLLNHLKLQLHPRSSIHRQFLVTASAARTEKDGSFRGPTTVCFNEIKILKLTFFFFF